jgi:hypothetical protein
VPQKHSPWTHPEYRTAGQSPHARSRDRDASTATKVPRGQTTWARHAGALAAAANVWGEHGLHSRSRPMDSSPTCTVPGGQSRHAAQPAPSPPTTVPKLYRPAGHAAHRVFRPGSPAATVVQPAGQAAAGRHGPVPATPA